MQTCATFENLFKSFKCALVFRIPHGEFTGVCTYMLAIYLPNWVDWNWTRKRNKFMMIIITPFLLFLLLELWNGRSISVTVRFRVFVLWAKLIYWTNVISKKFSEIFQDFPTKNFPEFDAYYFLIIYFIKKPSNTRKTKIFIQVLLIHQHLIRILHTHYVCAIYLCGLCKQLKAILFNFIKNFEKKVF